MLWRTAGLAIALGMCSGSARADFADSVLEYVNEDDFESAADLLRVEKSWRRSQLRRIATAALARPLYRAPAYRGDRMDLLLFTDALVKAIERADSTVREPRLRLDAAFFAYKSARLSAKPVPVDQVFKLADAYAELGRKGDRNDTARAVQVLRWARTLPGVHAATMKRRELAIAKSADDRVALPSPVLDVLRLPVFEARLDRLQDVPKERAKEGLNAILTDVTKLARKKDADIAVLNFHRDLVTRMRRLGMAAEYLMVRNDWPRFSAPRGGAWKEAKRELVRFEDDGRAKYVVHLDPHDQKAKTVRKTTKNELEEAQRRIRGGTVHGPERIRLTRYRRANMFEIVGIDENGKKAARRCYVWREKGARIRIVRVRAGARIDDPELDAVVASLADK